MSTKKVGFVHTTPATIGMAEAFMKVYLPGVEWIHMYDGNVKIANFASPIGVTPKINLLRYAVFADELERAGCGVIVSCCSLMPRATAYASAVVDVPFIQLDAVILDEAAANYRRIGVINTTPYSVPYIRERLVTRAERQGKKCGVVVFRQGNGESARPVQRGGFRCARRRGAAADAAHGTGGRRLHADGSDTVRDDGGKNQGAVVVGAGTLCRRGGV